MKSLRILIVISLISAAIVVSCRKNRLETSSISKSNHPSEKLTVEDAKSYHKSFENKYGNFDLIKISGKTEKNFKYVDFSHAYIGENKTSFFVEAPISYTKRDVAFSTSSSIPTSTLQKMFSNSFDRIVIYKDKMSGMIAERIVTFIPSVDYISNGHKNLYNNHYQSIVNEFSGYVTSKNWKGQFLSSQSYSFGKISYDNGLAPNSINTQTSNGSEKLHVSGASDVDCKNETIYRGYVSCEDFDADGNGVNCDYVIYSEEIFVCEIVDPVFHTPPAMLPNPSDPIWNGFPDPVLDPASSCPPTPRTVESPVLFADIYGSSFSLVFYDACFCQGYSWVIFEDANTGYTYSMSIDNQNFTYPGCTSVWETHFQIPASIPNGEYFIYVNLDGDMFYHQYEKNGTIIKRFKHILQR